MPCHSSVPFNPSTSIPSLTSKVLLITGSSSGLGQQCVLEYARHAPAKIYLAARSLTKAAAALAEIKTSIPDAPIVLLELDLSSLASVRTAAARVLSENDRLDILMLNAGIMATPPGLSPDGYEIQWATNYLGHALLTRLLMPLLERTAAQGNDVRVVSVSSYGHNTAPTGGIQWPSLTTEAADLGAYGRYGQSKLAQILWTRHMARLHPALIFASVHPGVVSTNLTTGATGSSWGVKMLLNVAQKVVPGAEKGARNQLWASIAEGVASGEYYEPVGVGGKGSSWVRDDELVKEVGEWTERELEKGGWVV